MKPNIVLQPSEGFTAVVERPRVGSGEVPSANCPEPVLLINMPFAFLFRPSLSLSLVKGLLLERRIPARILYASLQFAELVGPNFYFKLANETPDQMTLAGEWLFATSLFEQEEAAVQAYIENVLRSQSVSERFVRELVEARGKVETFLDGCLQQLRAISPAVVVFTTVAQQQVPALSLAKRIKKSFPSTSIVFAGLDWDGAMAAEVIRRFPFVDAAVAGEAETVFPELIERQLEGKSLADLQGVYTADNHSGRRSYPNTLPLRDLDALPFPDYDDFFDQLAASTVDRDEEPRLQFETSRGCWWGEKRHCTFCGLVGVNMTYRSKAPARALAELKYLAGRYPGYPLWTVDYILDMKYFRDFIPELASQMLGLELFYEVKSNLKKDQLRLLRDAGITMIQPGIESFSDRILELMRKGSRGLQNIQLLKWCKELGIKPFWNIIWGFPGEPSEEYARMAQIIRRVTHLPPPQYAGPISLERFSPHYDFADRFGFINVAPHPAYQHIYPFEEAAVTNLARHFVFDYRQPPAADRYTESLSQAVADWQRSYETSELFSVDLESRLLIWDLRQGTREPLTVLAEFQRELYLACDAVRTSDELERLSAESPVGQVSALEIEAALEPLVARGLLVRDGDAYLSLAIPLGEYSPAEPNVERFYQLVEQIGKDAGDVTVLPHSTCTPKTNPL